MGRHSGNHEKPMGKSQDPGKELEKRGLRLIAATLALSTLSELFQYSVSIKHALFSLTNVCAPKPNPVLNCPKDMWNKEVFDLSKQLLFQILESLNKINYWVQKHELLTALKLTTEQENNFHSNFYVFKKIKTSITYG